MGVKEEFEKIMDSCIRTKDKDKANKVLISESRCQLQADTLLVFHLDKLRNKWVSTLHGREVKVSFSKSVLSLVSSQKSVVSAKSEDQEYDERIEHAIGAKYSAMQVGPIYTDSNRVNYVLVVLRKRPEILFEKEFLFVLNIFSAFMSKWEFEEKFLKEQEKVQNLLDCQISLFEKKSLHEFTEVLKTYLCSLFSASRVNILYVDRDKNKIYKRSSEKLEYFQMSKGLAGLCISSQTSVLSNDIALEKNFKKEVDDPQEETTRNLLYGAVVSNKVCLGAVGLINKTQGKWSKKDQAALEAFLKVYSGMIVHLNMHQNLEKIKSMFFSLQRVSVLLLKDSDNRSVDYGDLHTHIHNIKNFLYKKKPLN